MFSNKIHLQTPNSNFGLNDLFKYFNINYGDEYLGILKKSYHCNNYGLLNYVETMYLIYNKCTTNKKQSLNNSYETCSTQMLKC